MSAWEDRMFFVCSSIGGHGLERFISCKKEFIGKEVVIFVLKEKGGKNAGTT